MSKEDLLEICRLQIEDALSWGPVDEWTSADFELLSQQIHSQTGTLLSPTTLKRLWGRVRYRSSPSTATLDTLAKFLGYPHWQAFAGTVCKQSKERQVEQPIVSKGANRLHSTWVIPGFLQRFIWPIALFLVLGVLLLSLGDRSSVDSTEHITFNKLEPSDFHFSSEPISLGIPNSVVFHYDASAAPLDSVFIQQNWDERRRVQVGRDGDAHSSIYYMPGFFLAKLLVSDQIVAEHELLIPSDGWTVAAQQNPIPVYFSEQEVLKDGKLAVTVNHLEELGLQLHPKPPKLMYSTVGHFPSLNVHDFRFTTSIRQTYALGAAACRNIRLLILLNDSAIILPLSHAGCVANLELFAANKRFIGFDHDLSAFGMVDDDWIDVSVEGNADSISIFLNEKLAWQGPNSKKDYQIMGLRYEFEGLGEIRSAELSGGGEEWSADF
ncbi:MAG: hypothetical protein AAFP08_09950 [Bacteroidota bacterium]